MQFNTKIFLLFSSILLVQVGYGQENELLDRTFWKSNPSLLQIKELVETGNSPSEFNQYNFDPAVYGILESIPIPQLKYLLSFPENPVDKITHDGRNYFLWAVYKGNKEIIELLIARGSNINLEDSKGLTALSFAVRGGHTDLDFYKYLVSKGLSFDYVNSKGEGFYHAIFKLYTESNNEQIKAFIKIGKHFNVDPQLTDFLDNTLIHIAAQKQSITLLDIAISFGIDLNSVNKEGLTPLHIAASTAKDLDFLKYLVSKNNIKKGIKTEFGETAYQLALENEQLIDTDLNFLK